MSLRKKVDSTVVTKVQARSLGESLQRTVQRCNDGTSEDRSDKADEVDEL